MPRLLIGLLIALIPLFFAIGDLAEIQRAHSPMMSEPVVVRESRGPDTGMVEVPGGVFLMGGEDAPEQMPVRRRRLPGFRIDRTEVTAGEFDRFLKDNRLSDPGPPLWVDGRLRPDLTEHPVYPVSWKQARDYCRRQGKRLPTEAEWEKAARGPNGNRFPWGDDFDNRRGNFKQTSLGRQIKSQPVGSYPAGASPYGALDMAGNVREWTADVYDPDAYKARPFFLRPPWQPAAHVLRGGSFISGEKLLTATHRSPGDLDAEKLDVGFRCAADD